MPMRRAPREAGVASEIRVQAAMAQGRRGQSIPRPLRARPMRSTRSRAPREHTARLARLHQFDRAIGEAESIEAIAEIAVRHLRELTRCHHASVITFDFVTDLATVAAEYSGGREPRRGGSRWPMDSADIPGELKSGRVALIDSSPSAEPSSPPPPLFGHEAGQRCLSVPLMAKGELIGALVLGSASPNAFTLADVETSLWMAES